MMKLLSDYLSNTQLAIKDWISNPTQALLLSGVTQADINEVVNEFKSSHRCRSIQLEEDQLGIENLRRFIRLATQKSSAEPQLCIIIGIHSLSIEAQNSLLKTIEEPSQSVHFLLTSSDNNSVLATIKSRCRIIEASAAAHDVFSTYDSNLLEFVKNFVRAEPTERLLLIKDRGQSRQEVTELIQALTALYSYLMNQQAKRQNPQQVATLLKKQMMLLEIQDQVAQNVSTKAAMSYICTAL